ncbi:eotaxin-like isoform X2 [Mustelus asterias]
MKCYLHIGLLLTMIWIKVSDRAAGTVTIECCENFKPTPIVHKRLVSYKKTIGCSIPAIVFTNRRNMRICAKANEKWVQTAVRFLEKGLKK